MRRIHGQCRSTHEAGWGELVATAAEAAESRGFSQVKLRQEMLEVARRSFHDGDGINRAIAEGWHRAVSASLADGILTRDEEERLRDFRERFAGQAPEDTDSAARHLPRR